MRLTAKIDSTIVPVNSTNYIGGIEYRNDDIQAIYHPEGRAVPSASNWRQEYVITDHLGNTRLRFSDLDGNSQIDSTEILDEIDYYPFGQPWQDAGYRYTYNGKELDRELGLRWHHYGARMYDPAIGRWNSVDPLAEKYSSLSTFSYVGNMPTQAIDPDGKRIIFINGLIGGGSPPEGAPYWNGSQSRFVKRAQQFFNDYQTPFFTDEPFFFLYGASFRERMGRKYAEKNYSAITDGLNKSDDVIRIITHSMGGAFGKGLKEYLESEGWTVSDVLHLNTFESDEINYDPIDGTRIIDYQNTDDPVIKFFDSNWGGGEIGGADIKIRVKSSKSNLWTTHRFPIDNADTFWNTLQTLINEYLYNQGGGDLPESPSNKGDEE
jgi:RHS repeat-associated protein